MSRAGQLLGLRLTAVVALFLAGSAKSQAGTEIDLGRGRSVRQVPTPCGAVRCLRWVPRGIQFNGFEDELAFARAFAEVPSTGRIVAAFVRTQTPFGDPRPLQVHVGNAGVLTTDDAGRHWRRSGWPWPHAANALAFDRETPFGVAVGDAGHVWSTDDGGHTWRERRADGAAVYTQVAVVGRLVVFADSGGEVFRSTDGGLRVRTLLERRGVVLSTIDAAIEVRTRSGELLVRVRQDGSTERH